MLKLKVLQASHPRVAGIVQAHRQQIDAAGIGRQSADRRGMYCLKAISRSGEVSSWRVRHAPVGFYHCARGPTPTRSRSRASPLARAAGALAS